jgi:hypothetical protein
MPDLPDLPELAPYRCEDDGKPYEAEPLRRGDAPAVRKPAAIYVLSDRRTRRARTPGPTWRSYQPSVNERQAYLVRIR